jgi:hypothetical protein
MERDVTGHPLVVEIPKEVLEFFESPEEAADAAREALVLQLHRYGRISGGSLPGISSR